MFLKTFHDVLRAFQMSFKISLIKHWFPGPFPEVILLWVFRGAQEHISSAQVEVVHMASILSLSGLILKAPLSTSSPTSKTEEFVYV